jgi:hypothetical protein
MAIRVCDRDKNAIKIQEVLTKHGCNINMRLGLHDQEDGNICSSSGTLILQLCCSPESAQLVEADLVKIDGVKAKLIDLN